MIFKGQSLVKIVLDTEQDLSTATSPKIRCRKPSGVTAIFNATIVGTTLEYEVQDGNLSESGTYSVQAYYEVAGRKAYGAMAQFDVKEPI